MDIRYKVTFFSDWHCGSGLAAGADLDALVIKDNQGLPYIPGKTIKGLLREAMEDIIFFRYKVEIDEKKSAIDFFTSAFGYFNGKNEESTPEGAIEEHKMVKGHAFFKDAELPVPEQKSIVDEHLQSFLYRTLSNTAIDKNGVAEEHSLRKTEVAVPTELEGEILNLPIEDINSYKFRLIKDSFRYIKRMGTDRNRGLGRCDFSVIEVIIDGKSILNQG